MKIGEAQKLALSPGSSTPPPTASSPRAPTSENVAAASGSTSPIPDQLEMKRDVLKRHLEEVAGLKSPNVSPTIASPSQSGYRNHARFSVDRKGSLGFTRTGTHRPLEIDRCLLMHDDINAVLSELQGKGKGLRQVAVRCGVNTGSLLIQPSLTIPDANVESGQPDFTESLFGYTFKVSSPSFFQVNTPQAERMTAELRDRLYPTGDELLFDAYGGVGTFAVLLAPYYREIVTLEESPSAIEDALVNCRPFSNVTVLKGKAEEVLSEIEALPDTVILDPPRVGCHPKILEVLTSLRPRKIAYVSCAPSTLARDLAFLTGNGYSLREAVPIDMFPQTHHVESISILERY